MIVNERWKMRVERVRERERELSKHESLLDASETISCFASYNFKTICVYFVILSGGLTFNGSKQQSHLNFNAFKAYLFFGTYQPIYNLLKAIIEI